MNEVKDGSILTAACFRLGLAGAQITQIFSERIEEVGITHKQVGLLAVVDAGLAQSQREIASCLRVAPSLVVSLVDQLVERGAVQRKRSSSDRRVQLVETTPQGKRLLAASERIANQLDSELRANLTPAGRSALDTLLGELEQQHPLASRSG